MYVNNNNFLCFSQSVNINLNIYSAQNIQLCKKNIIYIQRYARVQAGLLGTNAQKAVVVENKKGNGFVAYAILLPIVNVQTQMMYFRAIHTEHKQFLGQILKIFKPQTVLEQVCCKNRQKKSKAKNRLGNIGSLEALNNTKLLVND